MLRITKWFVQHMLSISFLVGCVLTIAVGVAYAIDLPPLSSAAFIQTSGPNAALNVGDYYTNNQGAQEPHYLRINIPCTWPPDQTITFALFDPELQEPDPDPAIEPPFADDEIRDDSGNTITNPPTENIQFADVATFTLVALDDQNNIDRIVLPPVTYTASLTNSTNGLWVELLTFTPNTPNFGCGVYALGAETSDNDDNAWKLSVGYDPDCTLSLPGNPGSCAGIGQAQSDLLNNGNEQDDADGVAGTGDELLISADQLSYQHENVSNTATTCQIFYHPVFADDMPEVIFNDFDLDIDNPTGFNSTVRHISPSGTMYIGAGSNNESWNNASSPPPYPPQRGGDLISIGPDDIGLWQTEICVRRDNQYIYEGQSDEVVFLEPPPIPVMEVVKDSDRSEVNPNDVFSYTIAYANVADTNPHPLPYPPPPPQNYAPPGAAFNVILQDELPSDTAFVSCRINLPFTGTCVESPIGIVTARINEPVAAGADGTLYLSVQVNADVSSERLTNTVTLNYTGILSEPHRPVSDTYVVTVPPFQPAPTATNPPPTATNRPPTATDRASTSTRTPTTPTSVVSSLSPTTTPTGLPILFLPETGVSEPWQINKLAIVLFILILVSVGLFLFHLGWRRILKS